MDQQRDPKRLPNSLIAVVAFALIVAAPVLFSDRSDRAPDDRPTPTPSPTASPFQAVARDLDGKGPYLVYLVYTPDAGPGEVFAYDLASKRTVLLGSAYPPSADGTSVQPASGQTIVFAAYDGTVWRLDRSGLDPIASVWPSRRYERLRTGDDEEPSVARTWVEGSAVSPDGRYLATAHALFGDTTIVMDLVTRTALRFPQSSMGVGRIESLIPIAWGANGKSIYQVPICHCGGGTPGLFRFDTRTKRSKVLGPTREEVLYGDVAISPDGRTVIYGTESYEPCEPTGSLCSVAPFELRRLSADGTRSVLLQSSDEAFYRPMVVSADGHRVLVKRIDRETRRGRFEMIDTRTGSRIGRAMSLNVSQDAIVRDILPDGSLVVYEYSGRIALARDGKISIVARPDGPSRQIEYLGWLR